MKLVAKILATLFLVAIFLSVLGSGTAKMGERSGVFHRYRDTPVAPRVHVVAVAHRLPNRDVPPICAVHREHWGSCGKSSCWRYVRGITTVTGNLEVKTATSSLPASLDMDSAWVMEPEPDYSEVTSAARKAEWQARGKKAGIDFDSLGADRLVERCIEEGETIYAVGFVEENKLTSCPFDDSWSFVPGDSPRPAILVATNDLAAKLAAAMAALFLVPLIWVPKRGALVEALAQRSGRPLKALKWSYALLLVLPIGLFFNFILKAKFGGFVFFAFVLVGWILIAANLLLRRRRVAQAAAGHLYAQRHDDGELDAQGGRRGL